MTQEIKINCDTKLYVSHKNLLPFQGELKTLSETNYGKLKKQILDQGFCAPCFVWKNDGKYFILDGHQRATTVLRLSAEGYSVPDLPCVEIYAKTKLEAKKKLLSYVSAFGKVEGAGLYQYILDAELSIEDLEDFEIPEINLEDFKAEFFGEESTDTAIKETDLNFEFKMEVKLNTEKEQETLYNELTGRGYEIRILS